MREPSSTSSAGVKGGLPPPPGVILNFIDPFSLQAGIIANAVLCLVLTTISSVLRAYTKLFIIKSSEWEDYM